MKGKNSEGKKQESMCFGIKNIYVSVLLLASRLGKLLKFFKPEFPLQNGVINWGSWATSHRKSNSVFKQWRGSVADIAEDQGPAAAQSGPSLFLCIWAPRPRTRQQ